MGLWFRVPNEELAPGWFVAGPMEKGAGPGNGLFHDRGRCDYDEVIQVRPYSHTVRGPVPDLSSSEVPDSCLGLPNGRVHSCRAQPVSQ
eukprot:15443264-Alexandrium_andersonii.AAC.1